MDGGPVELPTGAAPEGGTEAEVSPTARVVSDAIAYVCGLALAAATVAIGLGTFGRRLFAFSIPWAVDAAVLTMIVLTFLGATAVALHDGHITVDLVTSRLRGVAAHRLEVAGLVLSVVTLLLVAAAGLDHVLSDLASGRRYNGNFVRLPRALVIAFVPFGLVMLSGVYTTRLVRLVRRGPEP